jgi:hypothetical protein
LRRRLRSLVDLITAAVRRPARLTHRGGPDPPDPEPRSAEEVKRRLEDTHSRLKSEHPPLEDLDQL